MNRKDYPPDWKAITTRLKQKANWTCQKCGRHAGKPENLQLGVHHKDGDPTNNRESNLIVLCRGCHLAEHLKLQTYMHRREQEKKGQLSMISLEKPY